jgi:hypothetical protein
MFERLLDRLGEWNPQLWREIKSRVSLPGILAATLVSAIAQFIAWSHFRPSFTHTYGREYNLSAWMGMSEFLDREIWLVLALGGIYLIATNFRQELDRDTLNLVNLSPTSIYKIIIGKILGVPILLYWVVLLTMPLHFIAAYYSSCFTYHFRAWNITGFFLLVVLYLNTIFFVTKFKIPSIVLTTIVTALGWFIIEGVNISSVQRLPLSFGINIIDPCNFRPSLLDELSVNIDFAIVGISYLSAITLPDSHRRDSLKSFLELVSFPGRLATIFLLLAAIAAFPLPLLGIMCLIWWLSSFNRN